MKTRQSYFYNSYTDISKAYYASHSCSLLFFITLPQSGSIAAICYNLTQRLLSDIVRGRFSVEGTTRCAGRRLGGDGHTRHSGRCSMGQITGCASWGLHLARAISTSGTISGSAFLLCGGHIHVQGFRICSVLSSLCVVDLKY